MKKTKLLPVLFAVLMLFIFAAPVSAVDLDAGTCIDIGGSWDEFNTCTVAGDRSVSSSITIPIGITLYIGGNLTINNGAIIDNAGNIMNYGTISNYDTIINSGTINNNYNGTITNTNIGIINNSGIINNNAYSTINNSGTINNNASGTIFNGGGTFNNSGTINNKADSTIRNYNTINNNGGGIINNNAGGYIDNWGTINNNAGGTINNSGGISNSGAFNNSCGAFIISTGTISGNPIEFVCTSTSIPSTTGFGAVDFDISSGTIGNLSAVNLSTLPLPLPAGYNLTYGTFSFNITGITPGSSVTLTLTLPDDLPPVTLYWQYRASSWYSITPDSISGNQMTITLTDGDTGDVDGIVNGDINGSGGPGIPQTTVNGGILNATTCSVIGGIWSEPDTCTINVSNVVINTDFTIPDGTTLNIPVGKMLDISTIGFHNLGIIDNAGTISNNGGTINNTGTINNNGRGTINNSGTIINNFSGYIYNSGTLNNKAAGTIDNRRQISNNVGGTINNIGTINNSYISSNIVNYGAINNNGIINNIGSIYNHAGIIINNALGYIENRQSISNNGTISNGGSINNSNTIINSAGGTFNNNFGGIINNTDTITNTGIINNNAGGKINNPDTIENYGNINNKFGGTLNNTGTINNLDGTFTNTGAFANIGTITNYATINNNAGGIISNNANAEIRNWIIINNNAGGTIINSGNINNNGGINNGAISDIGIISDGGTISNIGNINNSNTINNNGDIINIGTIRNTHYIKNYCGGNITGSGTISVYQVISRCIQSSTGNGGVDFLNSAGTIENLGAVNLSTLPPPPDGSNLLYGTFSFNITGLDLRGDVTLVLTFPNVLPPGTVYWKYQANHNPQWYSITPDEINGTHMTITLTDGGIGDDDGFANRQIHDPGGPGAQIPEIQPRIASSSGSTGGGGVVTSEPLENIARAQSEDGDIHAGQSRTYDFSSLQCAYEIIATGSENENEVVIRVEELKGLSRIVKVSPTGTVYTNFNVWANTKRIKEALIRCKVENNWIVSNGFEKSDVKIQRWNNNSWTQLETKELRKDSNHTYYEAKTNGFSHFTVTGLKNEVEVTAIPVVSASEKPEVTESKELTSKPASLNWILYIVIGSLIFSGIYLYAIKRK